MGTPIPSGTINVGGQLQLDEATGNLYVNYGAKGTDQLIVAGSSVEFVNGVFTGDVEAGNIYANGSLTLGNTVINGYAGTAYTANIPAKTGSQTIAMLSDIPSLSGYVQSTRAINTSGPLTGGGDLSSDRTISIPAATNSVDGYLTAADHTTFAAKQSAITLTTTGTSGAATFAGNTLNIPQYTVITNYVTTNSAQSGLTGTKSWDDQHTFNSTSSGSTSVIGHVINQTWNTTGFPAAVDIVVTPTNRGTSTGNGYNQSAHLFRARSTTDNSFFGVGLGAGGNMYASLNGVIGSGNGPGYFASIIGDTESRISMAIDTSGRPIISFGSGTGRDAFIYRSGGTGIRIEERLGIGGNPTAAGSNTKLSVYGAFEFGDPTNILGRSTYTSVGGDPALTSNASKGFMFYVNNAAIEAMYLHSSGNVLIGTQTNVASSRFTIVSTTQGFRPPVMTTTQFGAISSKAEGLEAYNLTLHRPTVYDGTNVQTLVYTTDLPIYSASLRVTDATATPYSKTTLNSTYPSAAVGMKVICTTLNIVYEKYDSTNWFSTGVTILP